MLNTASVAEGSERVSGRWGDLAAGCASGALLVASGAPGPFGCLVLGALIPLLWVVLGARPARAAAAGFCCGLIWFGPGFLWMPWNVGGPGAWAVWALGTPFLAAPLAGVAALLAWVRMRAGPGAAALAAPALWTIAEHLRAQGPLGVPWLRLGYAPADHAALIQLAALGGVGLVSAWIVAVNAAIAWALRSRWPGRWLAPLAAGGPALAYGLVCVAGAPLDRSEPLRVGIVQAATPAEHRHRHERFDENLGRLIDLSRASVRDDPHLIVWPEGSFELGLGSDGHPLLGSIASTLGAPLLAGGRRAAAPGGAARWNEAVLADPDGTTRRVGAKVRPVPIYERAPGSRISRALARAGWWPGRVRPAREAGLAAVAPPGAAGATEIGVLVCIDATHPELARSLRRRGARALVSLANEAETGPWSAAQHAAMVRLRAVETGLPLVRVANTGPSVWIDPRGREQGRLAAGASAAATAPLSGPLAAPPYVAWGDAPVTTALCLLPAACVAVRRFPRAAREDLSAQPEEGAFRA